MTTQAKLEAIYQCSLEAEFRDMTAERESHEGWIMQTAHTRSAGPVASNEPWRLCIGYLRAKLAMGSDVFSLPLDLYSEAQAALAEEVSDDGDPVAAVLGAVDVAPVPFDMASGLDNVVFFEVVNKTPHQRSHVPLHHISRFTDVVHIVRRTVMFGKAETRQVSLLSEAGMHGELNLRVLVRSMGRTLRTLYRWKTIKYGSALTYRRWQAPPPVDRALEAPGSMILSLASSAMEQPTLERPSSSSRGLQIQRPVTQGASARILSQIRTKEDSGQFPDGVPMSVLDSCHIDDVQTLAARSAISMAQDDFGEVVLSTLGAVHAKYLSAQLVGEPGLVFHDGKLNADSKLAIMIYLRMRGWASSDELSAQPHVLSGGDLVFVRDLRRPTSYFLSLALGNELFEKGVIEVPHTKTDIYYKSLLRLSGATLREFLLGDVDDVWCRRALRDAPPLTLPLEDEDGDDGGEADALEGQPEPPPLMLEAPAVAVLPLMQRCIARGPLGDVRVRFATVTSDERWQRSFGHCLGGHENCGQWRQASDFASREGIAKYYYYWSTSHANFPDRQAHMAWRPSTDEVDASGVVVEVVEW